VGFSLLQDGVLRAELLSCRARESFARGKSDLLTDVNAYDAVAALRKTGGQSAVRNFCEQVGTAESTQCRVTGQIASQVVDSPLTLALVTEFYQRVDNP
jgi:hypothetical protein